MNVTQELPVEKGLYSLHILKVCIYVTFYNATHSGIKCTVEEEKERIPNDSHIGLNNVIALPMFSSTVHQT